jgi:succinyl-CoA synthetase alpha subunit
LPVKSLIKPSQYHDSVSLMLVAQETARLPGVVDAAVVMATEANKGILKAAGLLPRRLRLRPLMAGDCHKCRRQYPGSEFWLKRKAAAQTAAAEGVIRPKTRAGLKINPAANVAVISGAGRYAADEAWEALQNGLHVLLFSDNVALEDEIALKQYASQRGLLLMGPGAGTAILNGVALGFANVLPPGPVGIVSAAGTGLQEVSTLLAKHGVGITQGIGAGGRDLREEVGGLMMLAGLRALQADPQTSIIVLVSKPPHPAIAQRVLEQVSQSAKPTVICFWAGMRVSRSSAGSPHAGRSCLTSRRSCDAGQTTRNYLGGESRTTRHRVTPGLETRAALPARLILWRDAVLRSPGSLA